VLGESTLPIQFLDMLVIFFRPAIQRRSHPRILAVERYGLMSRWWRGGSSLFLGSKLYLALPVAANAAAWLARG
jgi:hypothetical protein